MKNTFELRFFLLFSIQFNSYRKQFEKFIQKYARSQICNQCIFRVSTSSFYVSFIHSQKKKKKDTEATIQFL